ncbi:capsid staple protein [Escherichia coli]
MELVNLKIGTDSYQDESGETKNRDEYPWGLCITLNNDTLNKLKAQPQGVGTEVMITAKAVIRGLSARETDDGVNRSADLVTDPLMEKEDDHRQTVDVLRSTGGN